MYRYWIFLVLVASFLSSSLALAAAGGAGWGASGGELLGDTLNPWWVKNTTNVNYCIDIDRNGISATPEKIQSLVVQALSFWKTELNRTISYVNGADGYNQMFSRYGVGSQTFTLVSCTGSEDLRFQFGYGTLSEKQKLRIRDPKQYVGVAVRTAYDETLLKGRGFIFIASDIGKNTYKNDSDLIDRPWSIDQLLYIVLLHEIGHVFGVPHVGSEYSLMSQQGPGYFITKNTANSFKGVSMDILTSKLNTFFFPQESYTSCMVLGMGVVTQATKDFFGFPATATCMGYELNESTKEISIGYGTALNSPLTMVGTISNLSYKASLDLAVMVKVNSTQTVLPLDANLNHTQFLVGPFFLDVDATGGIFHAKDGTEKSVFLKLSSQNSPQIYGVVNGTIETVY